MEAEIVVAGHVDGGNGRVERFVQRGAGFGAGQGEETAWRGLRQRQERPGIKSGKPTD